MTKKKKKEEKDEIKLFNMQSPSNYIYISCSTSGSTPVLLLDGRQGADISADLSTVVKQILYS